LYCPKDLPACCRSASGNSRRCGSFKDLDSRRQGAGKRCWARHSAQRYQAEHGRPRVANPVIPAIDAATFCPLNLPPGNGSTDSTIAACSARLATCRLPSSGSRILGKRRSGPGGLTPTWKSPEKPGQLT